MAEKTYRHKVTINAKRRQNKRASDIRKKGTAGMSLKKIFDNYYRDQVKALYRAVSGD